MPGLPIRQRKNNISERRKRLINILRFIQPLPLSPRLPHLLRPRKIHQIQLPSLRGIILRIILINRNNKNRMRSRGPSIHMGIPHLPIPRPNPHQLINIILIRRILLRQIRNIHPSILILLHYQIILHRIQQVLNFLQINLAVRNFHPVLNIRLAVVNNSEYSFDHSRDDTPQLRVVNACTSHCEGFSRGGLAVCENCAVESLHYLLDYWLGCNFVYLVLMGVGWENVVELKTKGLVFFLTPDYNSARIGEVADDLRRDALLLFV